MIDIDKLIYLISKIDFSTTLLFAYELKKHGSIKDFPREDIYFSGIPLIKKKNVLGFVIEVFSLDAREIIEHIKKESCIWN